jgi:hypothetical protein
MRIAPHGAVIHHVEHDEGASRIRVTEATSVLHLYLPHSVVVVYAEVVGMAADASRDSPVYQGVLKNPD